MGECSMGLLRGLCYLLCMRWVSPFFSPWNSYIAGLKTQEPSAQLFRPRGTSASEDLHRFVVRSLVKRSPDTEPQLEADEAFDEDEELSEEEEAARRGQVSFSITATFQALQQKLMRELWSRSPNRDVVARSRILRSEG